MKVTITEKQAQMLRERYAAKEAATNNLNLVLSAMLVEHTPCEVEAVDFDGLTITLKDPPEE